MSQKNETPILILALLLTAAILGGGFWLFKDKLGVNVNQNPSSNSSSSSPSTSKIQTSLGETLLIADDTTPQKEAGITAFSKKDFAEAVKQFQDSLKEQPNDPETLIYLNNAKAQIQGNPITIATAVPIGGNLNVSQEILRGIAQAQNEINKAGGLENRLLQVKIGNDDNNPEFAQQLAREFVKDDAILAVIGHNSSDATLAAASEYQQGNLGMISPTSDAKQISELGDYIFRTLPSIRFQANSLSRYLIEQAKKSNTMICYDSQAQYSQSLKEEFTSAIYADGGKIIQVDCDFSGSNFNAENIISQAISNGADSLLLIPSVNRLNLAIAVAKANQKRLALLGSSTLYTFQTLQEGQANVNGMILAVAWHPDAFTNNSFPQQARQLWGGDVNWRSATSYDAFKVIIAGLKQGGIGRQGLQQTLSNPSFSTEGATGNIQFLPSGDRNLASILVKVQPGQKSGTGFDFIPLK